MLFEMGRLEEGRAMVDAEVAEGHVLADKYRVERVLGRGGMGLVVAAHHVILDERVALKFLLPAALANPDAVARFEREARAAAKIKSEHVVRVMDVGKLDSGAPYIVMEYLEGEDLAAWLKRRGPLSPEQATDFVLQACLALAEAHGAGIVHRDLKPSNLFCVRGNDGRLLVKTLDFGISKLTDTSGDPLAAGVTGTCAVLGSPLYMSPEQVRSAKNVDARTDIWSLGVVLFELVTGQPPFSGEAFGELAINIATQEVPAVGTYRSDIPPGLEAVILKCLEKRPDRRYNTVAELALALHPFAPPTARALVERITAIVERAGRSEAELPATEPAVPMDRTMTASLPDTVAPWERERGASGGRNRTLAGIVLFAAAAAAIGFATRIGSGPSSAASSPTARSDIPASSAAATQGASSSAPANARTATLDSTATPANPSPRTATLDPTPGLSNPLGGTTNAAAPLPSSPRSPTPSLAPSARRGAAPRQTAPAALKPVLPPPSAIPPAPAPRSAATPNCDPPYRLDGQGRKVFKPECF